MKRSRRKSKRKLRTERKIERKRRWRGTWRILHACFSVIMNTELLWRNPLEASFYSSHLAHNFISFLCINLPTKLYIAGWLKVFHGPLHKTRHDIRLIPSVVSTKTTCQIAPILFLMTTSGRFRSAYAGFDCCYFLLRGKGWVGIKWGGGADSREFLKQVFFFKGLGWKNRRKKKKKGLIVRRMRGWPAVEKCCIVWGKFAHCLKFFDSTCYKASYIGS